MDPAGGVRRYEVAFASISGRGELGERVLVETARALGLREGLHFTVQTDVAGGGAAKPDMVLMVGGGRTVPVDAKASLACWAEAVETDDPEERLDALRVHVRNLRSRAAELSGKNYQRWADAIYGTVMFVPSDAAVVAALDTDPELLRWLLDRRVFLCGPTGVRGHQPRRRCSPPRNGALADDVEKVRAQAEAAHRAASNAIEALNLSDASAAFPVRPAPRGQALDSFRAQVAPSHRCGGKPLTRRRCRTDEISAT